MKTFDVIINFITGLKNNAGIGGRIILICLAPVLFALLATVWAFKLTFQLLNLLTIEINFYWAQGVLLASSVLNLLDDFITKKIITLAIFLWKRLFDSSYTLRLNAEENTLEKNWLSKLIGHFFLQLLFFITGIILLVVTFSSLIYATIFRGDNLFVLWALRLLILTPLLHRYLRYKIQKKEFSWVAEETEHKTKRKVSWLFIFFCILIVGILLLFKYQTEVSNYWYNTFLPSITDDY